MTSPHPDERPRAGEAVPVQLPGGNRQPDPLPAASSGPSPPSQWMPPGAKTAVNAEQQPEVSGERPAPSAPAEPAVPQPPQQAPPQAAGQASPGPPPTRARRPRSLVLVVAAWLIAAALTVTGTFLDLLTEVGDAAGPATSGTTVSTDAPPRFESSLTSWSETDKRDGTETPTDTATPAFGVPLVVGAAGLLAAVLLGAGALVTGSGAAWRWSVGLAGGAAALVAGAVWTLGVFIKTLLDQIDATNGSTFATTIDASAGAGLWMLLGATVLALVAVAVGLIARAYLGPQLLRPPAAENREDPPTPPFGVPVIRPVGYD